MKTSVVWVNKLDEIDNENVQSIGNSYGTNIKLLKNKLSAVVRNTI